MASSSDVAGLIRTLILQRPVLHHAPGAEIHHDLFDAVGCPYCADDLDAALRACADPPERMFPIQNGPDIPWRVIAPFEKRCQRNHGRQTLERMAERGGLGVTEALAVLHDEDWDERYKHGVPKGEVAILELEALVRERLRACAEARPSTEQRQETKNDDASTRSETTEISPRLQSSAPTDGGVTTPAPNIRRATPHYVKRFDDPDDPPAEICICAAVQFADGRIVRGHRHDSCFRTAEGWTPKPPREHVQGFITSRNRFVNRTEGASLQNAAGLISAHTGKPVNGELFSEDLYFDTHDHVAWNTPYQEPADALAPPEPPDWLQAFAQTWHVEGRHLSKREECMQEGCVAFRAALISAALAPPRAEALAPSIQNAEEDASTRRGTQADRDRLQSSASTAGGLSAPGPTDAPVPIDRHQRAERLWEQVGGDLCICQRPEVTSWCESCQRRINIIAAELSRENDVVRTSLGIASAEIIRLSTALRALARSAPAETEKSETKNDDDDVSR